MSMATALSCRSPREYVVGVKEKLAKRLIQKSEYSLAKKEIEELIAIRNSNKWRLTSQVSNWQKSEWYNNTVASKSNLTFYQEQKNQAIQLLYPNLDYKIATVYYVNKERGFANWVISPTENGFFKFSPFFKNLNPGDNIKLGFEPGGKTNHIITAEKTTESSAGKKDFTGTLELHHSGKFGFVDDIFVHKDVFRNISDGAKITGKAVLSYEKRKDKWGWKAYELKEAL